MVSMDTHMVLTGRATTAVSAINDSYNRAHFLSNNLVDESHSSKPTTFRGHNRKSIQHNAKNINLNNFLEYDTSTDYKKVKTAIPGKRARRAIVNKT